MPSLPSIPISRLPNQGITAFYRSDPSGENYLLSVTTFSHTANARNLRRSNRRLPCRRICPAQPSATWAVFPNGTPDPNFASLVSVNGADAASQAPKNDPGGISFVETAYAKNVNLPVASVVNEDGNAVQPTAEISVEALEGATLHR